MILSGFDKFCIGTGRNNLGEVVKLIYNNEEVTEYVIPDGVTSISDYAFCNCSGLKSIIIPQSVTEIGYGAFSGCSGLFKIDIPNSVISIGDGTFADCSGLSIIDIPNSVISIGDYAFRGCNDLTSVTIPDSVTSIGDYAFSGCNGLTSVSIGNSVTSIGAEAFSGCNGLTSVTIPNSVTSIGNDAFAECNNLTSVSIGNSVTEIGNSTFWGCDNLTSVSLGNSVTKIGDYAFRQCGSLTSITIPNSVTEIGYQAFRGCSSLNELVCKSSNTPIVDNTSFILSQYKTGTLYVPSDAVEKYKSADTWKDWGTIKVIEDPEAPTIADNSPSYSNDVNKLSTKITYIRQFNDTNLQALYIPFSISYNDWSDDFKVYSIHGFYEYDTDKDGVIDEYVLCLMEVTEMNGYLKPNYPYVIKAKSIGEKRISATDAILYAAEINSIDCSTVETKYTFTGTYSQMTGLKSDGYYSFVEGKLRPESDDDATLGAFRWYMKMEDKSEQVIPRNSEIKIRIISNENEADRIEGVEYVKPENERVYSIDGRAVQSDSNSLRPGMYIKNGKKFVVI